MIGHCLDDQRAVRNRLPRSDGGAAADRLRGAASPRSSSASPTAGIELVVAGERAVSRPRSLRGQRVPGRRGRPADRVVVVAVALAGKAETASSRAAAVTCAMRSLSTRPGRQPSRARHRRRGRFIRDRRRPRRRPPKTTGSSGRVGQAERPPEAVEILLIDPGALGDLGGGQLSPPGPAVPASASKSIPALIGSDCPRAQATATAPPRRGSPAPLSSPLSGSRTTACTPPKNRLRACQR